MSLHLRISQLFLHFTHYCCPLPSNLSPPHPLRHFLLRPLPHEPLLFVLPPPLPSLLSTLTLFPIPSLYSSPPSFSNQVQADSNMEVDQLLIEKEELYVRLKSKYIAARISQCCAAAVWKIAALQLLPSGCILYENCCTISHNFVCDTSTCTFCIKNFLFIISSPKGRMANAADPWSLSKINHLFENLNSTLSCTFHYQISQVQNKAD